jgi:hypothetical protein
MFRAIVPARTAARAFSTTPRACKSITDSVKDTADKVRAILVLHSLGIVLIEPYQLNKTVGQTLAAGIEKGQETAQTTKETIGAFLSVQR